MMRAIVYESYAGHTQRYAQMLSKRTGLEALPLKEALSKLESGAEVVFMGWLFASKICGLEKARKRFQVRAVCGVGSSTPGEQALAAMRSANPLGEAGLFYCQGGLDRAKLNPLYRALINAQVKDLKKNERRTEQQSDMLKLLESGADLVNEAALDPLASYLNAR